uniref:Glycosyl transferase CAP10 domain-containing protein n=1 Tax=Dunaliella tertiolecta TaxID=3047 RepID=A0A7S3QMI7_DUNTE|mmetsp:Transcript_28303/g.76447  ORF Transcript_28303/g.76447 Transcript_28303/m.76447 type:complete len:467 (-) Transcript_28303:184-1584(-)
MLYVAATSSTAPYLDGASGTVTGEHEARAQKLLQENLVPTLEFWKEVRTLNGGRKLTMQNWFKTANVNLGSRFVAFWGIKNNKVWQLDKDGELRSSNDAMMLEGKPNRGAAESMKNSLWLAIEDASAHGVNLPDVMFMYNSADGPQCNLGSRMNCSDGTLAPPLSLMGLDVDKVDVLPRSLQGKPRPKAFPDLLVPVFKNLGYAQYVTVSPGPHHPNIIKRQPRSSWTNINRVRAERTAWEQRAPKMFFRGTMYCPYLKFPHPIECPRMYLSNLSIHHQDKLDIMVMPPTSSIQEEFKIHGWRGAHLPGMQGWTKFKYIITIDGLAGSNRDLALLHMGSVLIKQYRSPYLEWYYNSIKPGVHYEEVFKPRPDGSVNADDALDLVDRLRSDDAYARSLAENGLAFARNYLTAEVMFVYLRELLLAYKDLFEDMDAYLSHYPPDTGSSALFTEHARAWQTAPWKAGQR